ncbi:MAG: class I SAM-dependent methyltransferase [Ferrovibrio sp.]
MTKIRISKYSEQYLNLTADQVRRNLDQIDRRVEAFRLRIDLDAISPFIKGPDVLDFPIGTGRLYPHLMKHYTVWGYDIAPAYVERARKLNPSIADHFKPGQFEDVPQDRCFDTIVSFRVMYNVADFPSAARNVASVLKPGGRWIFNYPHEGRHTAEMPQILAAAGMQIVTSKRYDGYTAIESMSRWEKAAYDRFAAAIKRGWVPFALYRLFEHIYGPRGTTLWVFEKKI